MESNVVMVKLWGMPVGYLSWDKKADLAVFEYESKFIDKIGRASCMERV